MDHNQLHVRCWNSTLTVIDNTVKNRVKHIVSRSCASKMVPCKGLLEKQAINDSMWRSVLPSQFSNSNSGLYRHCLRAEFEILFPNGCKGQ